MIKGWRLNPGWCGFKEQQASTRMLERAMKSQLELAQASSDRNAAWIEEQRRHNAECHARKEAAGELASQTERHDH